MMGLLGYLLLPTLTKLSILNILETIGPSLFYVTSISCLLLIIYGCLPILRLYKSGYKHPIPVPFLGTTFWIMLDGFQKCYSDWNRKYGQVYAVADSQKICLMVSDPELLKEITIKSFSVFPNRRVFPLGSKFLQKSLFVTQGDEWRWARKLILPTFTSSKMRHNMFGLIAKCSNVLVEHMKDEVLRNKGKDADADGRVSEVEVKTWFGCFTMDVIASTAFGLELDSHTDKNNVFVSNARKIFEFEVVRPAFALLGLFPFTIPLLNALKVEVFDSRCLQFFADIVDQTVDRRRELNIRRNDYLQILMDSNEIYNSGQREHEQDPHHVVQNGVKASPEFDRKQKDGSNLQLLENDSMTMQEDETNHAKCPDKTRFKDVDRSAQVSTDSRRETFPGGLPRAEYVANALLFFIAGYESTANALSWISRTLAWYPDVQERMREEVMDSIKNAAKRNSMETEGPDLLNYDDIMDMKYMDQIIKETLRLYPPISFIDRVASEDYELDGKIIKKGTIINIPIYALHRDERLWKSPEVFDPERFSPERSSEINPSAYMPFGIGPRNCIGLRFALLEIKTGLAFILGSNLKFVKSPNDTNRDITPENTAFRKNGINYPKNGLYVGIEFCD